MKLSKRILDQALRAAKYHGYGTFFPMPPEFKVLAKNWPQIRTQLSSFDLDTYNGYPPVRSFAPKSRVAVRRVVLLHPYDFILYTAIALSLRDCIAASRLPADRVFSYRTETSPAGRLYESPGWQAFKEAADARATENPSLFFGITDIADFYPRIYHHRLVNALEAAAAFIDKDHKETIRVLEKMLARFSEGTSYGIPVGPPASRVLAEAVLIDMDRTLLSYDIDFIRFVDDFIIFGKRPSEAEYGLRVLGENLFAKHGLTLQAAKTRVLPAEECVSRVLRLHSEKEKERRHLFDLFESEYEVVPYEDLNEEQKAEIDALNLSEMLNEALAQDEKVDYAEVDFILRRLSSLRKPELIPIVTENLERLYPVTDALAAFFTKFSDSEGVDHEKIAARLLDPILNIRESRASEFYCAWVLSIFQGSGVWGNADTLLRIFRETNSDVIRRSAALALAVCGTRAQTVTVKEYLGTASSLSRTAMLLATAKLGKDERKYLKSSLRLEDEFELLCAGAAI